MSTEPAKTRAPRVRRWLKSAILTAAEPLPVLPFQRGTRRRPAALAPRSSAIAAR